MVRYQSSCVRAAAAHLMARRILPAALLCIAVTLAGAAPPELAPSPFIDGTQVDTEVLGTRIPVVLVHGLGGSPEGWDRFLRAYEASPAWRAAFKPYSFRYSSTRSEVTADPAAPRTITALGAALRDAMQNFYDRPTAAPDFGFGNKRVIVLAHSMGGLVARSMMQEYAFRDGQRGGQKVLHLITLGTPHHGTPLSDAAFRLGLDTVNELDNAYPGFVAETSWTNFDRLDSSSLRCNQWLARLNNYAPSNGADYGRCGSVPANPLPGYYHKVIAYAANALQDPDDESGAVGVYKPGSSADLYISYNFLRGAFSRPYPNDGVVPLASALFEGPALWLRREAYDCDHRYMRRGYPEFVRSPTATYTDWAFCAGTVDSAGFASGIPGGYALSGSILGAPGGIIETIRTVSQVERVFDYAESAYAAFLQPAGATSDIALGFYYRYYPFSQAYVGVKDGNVYYLGPASNNELLFVTTLADFLAQAQGAGF
ncbi:MAG TPA: alpha/beta fold hydrolase [Ramlibacter sp.]|nr:alpha/beta fold hydrolase [Ramlibacter sp.]